MAMIKANKTDQMMHDVIVLDLGDLRKQADQIKLDANTQAQQVIDLARDEARNLTSGAEEKGYQAGYQAGRDEGVEAGKQAGHAEALQQSKKTLDELATSWNTALDQWDRQRQEMLIEARQSIMKLAIEIAAKIVKRIPQIDPLIINEQIVAAIEHVARPCDITIHINAEDRLLVEQALPSLIDSTHRVEHAHLTDDPSVGRGGCVVSYGQGRIDATLDGQLKRMVEALMPGIMNKKDLQRIVRVTDDVESESIDETMEKMRSEAIEQAEESLETSPVESDEPDRESNENQSPTKDQNQLEGEAPA